MTKSSLKKSVTKKRASEKKTISTSAAKKAAPKKVAPKNTTVKKQRKKKEKDNNKIILSSILAINDAKKMYDEFAKAIKTGKEVVIDASSVEMIDTAMLQLILAFVSKAQLNSVAVKWLKPSNELLNRSELLNLKNAMGLSKVEG